MVAIQIGSKSKENWDSFRINPQNPIKSAFYQYVRKTV